MLPALQRMNAVCLLQLNRRFEFEGDDNQYLLSDSVFEEDYKITIMDNQCNIFTISNNEYILINKDDYEIKPVDEEDIQDLHDVHDVQYDSESDDTVIVEGNVQDLNE
jgi:hypothetical protein